MIADDVLARQRIGARPETRCPGCGRRTTDKTGTCVSCRSLRAGTLRWERMTVEQLAWIRERAAEELRRRQAEITRALEEKGT